MAAADSPLTEQFLGRIVKLVDSYQRWSGESDSSISRQLVGGQDFVKRLRDGGNVQLAKVRQLEQHIRKLHKG